ncbi:hypothetical protein CUMW_121010 [Citrus unshiu]|nr:hypothetical protein CUMW_121010 [Citrus unshiu]
MGSLTGIGFRPLDEEIIDLLKKKRLDPGSSVQTIKEIDFYSFDPWELPGLSEIQSTEDVWYFFCKPKYKGAKRKRSGQQRHRKTKSGTWKMTGGGSEIKRKNSTEVIGDKDYLVFIHDDAASEKANTKWLMHEIAIADDPLYKENFVVCRLEGRNWDKKLGVSTPDKHQSSQDFASSSSINVVEDISLESAQPPDRYLVSTTNQVVENIFLKTQLPPSENLFSCNEDSATTSLDSGLSPQNTYTGLQLVPHDVLESLRLPDEQWATYSVDVVENSFEAEPRIPVEFNTHGGFNGLNNDSFLALQSPTYLEQESSYSNGPSFGCDLLNYQIDSGPVIAFSELQQLPNHLISCFGNHVAENTYTGLQLVPHHVLESLRLPDEQWATYSVDVVENSFEAEPRIPAEFNTHGGFNGLNNDSFLALQSPTYLEQESSYSNGPSFGCDLLNSQIDSGRVIAFSESQQLPNHLISCSGNYVAENTSTGLQQVPHGILESQILSNQYWAAYSTSAIGNSFEAEPQLVAEVNTHGGYNGLNNASLSALQSPIYPEEE